MKKQVKKLVLAKETLRSLETAVMKDVVGADSRGSQCCPLTELESCGLRCPPPPPSPN
jgi:hypothetical protein